ncbi:hypothetical protein CK203_092674 [Vitis vinifera]|uniref:Reverse transcriptase zinc-binding domain-containing protein n=1 Tax=Vitis vinifera TaxID=29760 RepID=A0A438ENZ8_VITVI|nr:hypothetical protein CK203_092674 [Vitis vinifera]
MEALSQLLSRARNEGFFSGFKVGGRGREGLIVSHLLFADDTLIFCDADAVQLQYLSWTFMWFEAISGLKVNLSKSEAIPVGECPPMESLVSILGCKIGCLSTSYLGLPLGAPYKSTSVWDAVEERFRKRLSLWKRQYLSKGGALENKPHLVCWKVICAVKKDGGLGIRNLAIFNKALLGVRDRYGVGVWKAIRNGWENFRSHSRFLVGDGTRVKFWKDLWCENQSLEEAFPILFNLSVNKEGLVAEAWEEDGAGEAGDLVSTDTSMIGSSLSMGINHPFPASTIWKSWAPTRASFFGWEAAWNRLLTIDRLKRFGQNVMVSNLLPFWGAMGDALLCEKESPGMVWIFCGQEKGESMENCPSLPNVDYLERKE